MAGLDDPFARIPKSLLNDARLSWRAKGVLSYLLGKPTDWKLRVSDIVKHGKEGRDAVWAALNELRAFGYASFTFDRSSGKFSEGVWRVCDSPVFSDVPPCPEKPDAVKPDTGIPYHTKKESTDNDSTKKERVSASKKKSIPPQLPPKKTPNGARPPFDTERLFGELPASFGQSEEFCAGWDAFVARRKQPWTERAIDVLVQNFKAWGVAGSVASLNAAEVGGYQSLFPPSGKRPAAQSSACPRL